MLNQNSDWTMWKRNPPLASHMSGIRERKIRYARGILSSFQRTHSRSLDEEPLNTLSTEVKTIINSRPLVVETISDANSEVALSPKWWCLHLVCLGHLICTAKNVGDEYSSSATNIWSRWRKELLATLQETQKWLLSKRNFRVGDILYLKEVSNWNKWKLAKVIDV